MNAARCHPRYKVHIPLINEHRRRSVQGAYGATVAAALLFWHYLLTLDKEVAYFWKRGFAGGTVLFFANRYLTLAYSIHNAFLGPFIPSGPDVSTKAANLGKCHLRDVAVLVATWVATKDSRSEDVLHGFGRTTTLSEVIFKTGLMSTVTAVGTIYFLAMTTMNALYPAAYVLTVIPSTSAGANPLSGLFQSTYGSITAILVTQFLIALQEAVNATVHISAGSNALGTWAAPSNGMQSLIEFARADVDSLGGHGSIGADDSRSE
ncbi:hypothetical protein BC628DRAFT_1342559 [Trametes gibbosa]|nr:hypothetical protein BC628DRAFT_1342559 [Trametes gibbosa]